MNKKRMLALVLLAALVVVVMIVLSRSGSRNADPTAGAIRPVAVETRPVTRGTIDLLVTAVGTVAAKHDVQVSSETMGRVTRIPVQVGDRVTAGQTLVEVDNELKVIAVEQARAALLAAETNVAKAKKDLERAEKLFQAGDVADVELEGTRLAFRSADAGAKGAAVNLKLAERQLADTRIKSPVSGSVAAKMIELGEMVTPGKVVANIVDTGNLKVLVSIPEDQIGRIRPSQDVRLRVDSDPGEAFRGTVTSVGAKAEARAAHTYPVEIAAGKEAANAFKVGMFARVEIRADRAEHALLIPKEAVLGGKEKPAVFVVEQGFARLRPVRLGIADGERYHVTEGLQEGEMVVTFGLNDLRDGTPVQHK